MVVVIRKEFLRSNFVRKPPDVAGAVGLDYPSTEVGAAGNISVWYATSLGYDGETLAKNLLGAVTGPYSDMASLFGIAGGSVTVVVAPLSGSHDGTGGAYHYGCDFSSGNTLYLDATFALSNATDVEESLYIAELSECFMGAQGRGWGCGDSNGEGLSRFCAEVDGPAGSFPSWGVTGPSWVAAGYPDYVTTTKQTDRDYASTGCAVLYLYWMLSLGYTAGAIIQAGGATLADNYKQLTRKESAFVDLKAAVQSRNVTSDNPFGGGVGSGVMTAKSIPHPCEPYPTRPGQTTTFQVVAADKLFPSRSVAGEATICVGPNQFKGPFATDSDVSMILRPWKVRDEVVDPYGVVRAPGYQDAVIDFGW